MRAFPFYYEVKEDDEMIVMHEGMTLRDYFAGQAMVGYLSGPWATSNKTEIVEESYKIADLMMEAREK